VLILYKKLLQAWNTADVPLQHRVAFIESVKVLDMKMMAQIFEKEVKDFSQGQSPILSCMATIKRREDCLKEILSLNQSLEGVAEEEQGPIID
jgi:hypothetical protein